MTKRPKKLSLNDQAFYDKHRKYVELQKDGTTVFRGTNLSVFYVGSLLSFGETKTSILSEYQALNPDDLKFAKMFHATEAEKSADEFAPDYDSTQAAIDKFKAAAEGNKTND